MMTAKNTVRAALRTLRGWKARPTLAEIGRSASPTLASIGRAVQESLAGDASPEEEAVIARIERRRQELLSSGETIPVIDYGAGSADARRSEEEMRRGVETTAKVSRVTGASKQPFWAFLLFKLIRHLQPFSCLELGSCVGVSASYQAAALGLNGGGRLITLEGSPEIARLARETLAGLEFGNASVVTGPFYQTYADALASVPPVDFLFNDGHHNRDALLSYFTQALPHLAADSVIVFDDISWSPGMRQAWTEIENHPRIDATVDLGVMGIAVLTKQEMVKRQFIVRL